MKMEPIDCPKTSVLRTHAKKAKISSILMLSYRLHSLPRSGLYPRGVSTKILYVFVTWRVTCTLYVNRLDFIL